MKTIFILFFTLSFTIPTFACDREEAMEWTEKVYIPNLTEFKGLNASQMNIEVDEPFTVIKDANTAVVFRATDKDGKRRQGIVFMKNGPKYECEYNYTSSLSFFEPNKSINEIKDDKVKEWVAFSFIPDLKEFKGLSNDQMKIELFTTVTIIKDGTTAIIFKAIDKNENLREGIVFVKINTNNEIEYTGHTTLAIL